MSLRVLGWRKNAEHTWAVGAWDRDDAMYDTVVIVLLFLFLCCFCFLLDKKKKTQINHAHDDNDDETKCRLIIMLIKRQQYGILVDIIHI